MELRKYGYSDDGNAQLYFYSGIQLHSTNTFLFLIREDWQPRPLELQIYGNVSYSTSSLDTTDIIKYSRELTY